MFRRDEWLAHFLNKPCFSFSTESISAKELVSKLEEFKSKQPSDFFLFTKIPTYEVDKIAIVEDSNFRLVDTNVQMMLNGLGTTKDSTSIIEVRVATSRDKDSVISIAKKSFKYSRFHIDPQVLNDIADEIKGAWVKNYFIGKRGDNMLVAELDREIVGFVQLFERTNHFIIDLIAVHPDHYKKGIGRILVNSCTNYYGKFSYGLVGTQIANTPSLNLYEKCGYQFNGASYVFHYHHKLNS